MFICITLRGLKVLTYHRRKWYHKVIVELIFIYGDRSKDHYLLILLMENYTINTEAQYIDKKEHKKRNLLSVCRPKIPFNTV